MRSDEALPDGLRDGMGTTAGAQVPLRLLDGALNRPLRVPNRGGDLTRPTSNREQLEDLHSAFREAARTNHGCRGADLHTQPTGGSPHCGDELILSQPIAWQHCDDVIEPGATKIRASTIDADQRWTSGWYTLRCCRRCDCNICMFQYRSSPFVENHPELIISMQARYKAPAKDIVLINHRNSNDAVVFAVRSMARPIHTTTSIR
jgi:hypothetical protein